MTRRLAQLAVISLVVAGAVNGQAHGLRRFELRVAGVALFLLAVGLVLRPLLYGLQGERRRDERRRRDWPWE